MKKSYYIFLALFLIPKIIYCQYFEWSGYSFYVSSSQSCGVAAGLNVDYNGNRMGTFSQQICLMCTGESGYYKRGLPGSFSYPNFGFGVYGTMAGDSANNSYFFGKSSHSFNISGVNVYFETSAPDSNAFVKFDTAGVGMWGCVGLFKNYYIDYSGNSYLVNFDSLYMLNTAGQQMWVRNTGGAAVFADTLTNYFVYDTVSLKKFDAAGNQQWSLPVPAGAAYRFDKMGNNLYLFNADSIYKYNVNTGAVVDAEINFAPHKSLLFNSNGDYYGSIGSAFHKFGFHSGSQWQFTLPGTGNSQFGIDMNDNLYFSFGVSNGTSPLDVLIPPSLYLYSDGTWHGAWGAVVNYKISPTDSIQNGTITTGNVKALCYNGGIMDVPFTYNNYYVQYVDSGFRVELSDSTGSFVHPLIIGKGKRSPIRCTVPFFNANSSNWRVRVVSNSMPEIVGTPSSYLAPAVTQRFKLLESNYNMTTGYSCAPVTISVEPHSSNFNYKWSWRDYNSNDVVSLYNTTYSMNALYAHGESYMVEVTDTTTGCIAGASSHHIETDNTQTLNFNLPDTVCSNSEPLTLNKLTYHGAYTGTGIYNNKFYPDSAGAGLHTLTYTNFDTVSCYPNTATTTLLVDSCIVPLRTTYINNRQKNKFCVGDTMYVEFEYDSTLFPAGTWFYLEAEYYNYYFDSSQTSPIRYVVGSNVWGEKRWRVVTKTPVVKGTFNYDGPVTLYSPPAITYYTANNQNTNCAVGNPVLLKIAAYPTESFIWHADSVIYTDNNQTFMDTLFNYTYYGGISTFLVPRNGDYWVEVVSPGGCRVISDTIHVADTLTNVTAAITTTSNPFCPGDSALVSIVTDSSNAISWFYGGNTITPASPYSFYTSNTGTYTLVLNAGNQCSNQYMFSINKKNPTIPGLYPSPNKNYLCPGDSLRFSIGSGLYSNFLWYKDGVPFPGSQFTGYSSYVKDSGNYTVTAIHTPTNCAVTSYSKQIKIMPRPVPNVLTDSLFSCLGGPYQTITVNADSGTATYKWHLYYGGSGQSTWTTALNPYNITWSFWGQGYYSFSLTDSFCTSVVVDSFYNATHPQPNAGILPLSPTTFCVGDSALLTSLVLNYDLYSWYSDSTFLAADTNPVYTAYTAGNYYLVINDAFCTDTSNVRVLTTPCTVGIEEAVAANGIVVYPNPVEDLLTIEIKNSQMKGFAEVYTLDGKLVDQFTCTGYCRRDLKKLAPAVYLLKIIADDTVYSRRMVKQ